MTLDILLQKIKKVGGRITKTRTAVLGLLLSASKPLSASELLICLKEQRVIVDRTTIYRELNFLINHNLLKEVRLIGEPSLFELQLEHCHHLVCLKCHAVKKITICNHLESQEQQIMKKEKFKISDHSLEFYGLCHLCQ
jgi:Fe2+ or Zn2+ uptake regulation protein